MTRRRRTVARRRMLTASFALASLTLLFAACDTQGGSGPAETLDTFDASTTSTSPISTPSTSVTPPPPSVGLSSDRWSPAPGVTWQWQLTGKIDTSVDAQMYDIDLFDTPKSTVATLQSQGRAVVCYLSAGSWEDWRPDAGDFPAAVLGNSNGWPGERWLDIRRIDLLGPIMEARFDLCEANGYDGIEVDNIDGYTNRTGFPLTASDQLAYNRFLANAAHDRGLSIGLKNDVDQVDQLVDLYDFAINEQCAQYNECDTLTPFIDAGKAVFHVEYSLTTSTFCPTTTELGFSSMRKHLDLDAWKEDCPQG